MGKTRADDLLALAADGPQRDYTNADRGIALSGRRSFGDLRRDYPRTTTAQFIDQRLLADRRTP